MFKLTRKKFFDPAMKIIKAVPVGLIDAAKIGETQATLLTRVDTGELRSRMKSESVGLFSSRYYNDAAHAKAQEYGRPDIPAYGFTPYMRPAGLFLLKAIPRLFSGILKKAFRG